MVRGRGQGRSIPAGNPNLEFMTLLLNIQRRLDDQVAMMQQQADLIQNLQQQQQGRVLNPDQEGPEDEGVNMDPVYEEEDLGGNGEEEPPVGAPGGVGPRVARNPPPQPMRREYLCERLCKMKPPLFEGTTNPLEAEDWLSTMETILDFMELRDEEKITCAVYVLRKEARYWWDAVKTRRVVQRCHGRISSTSSIRNFSTLQP